MIDIKCKKCGGMNKVDESHSNYKCEYCDSEQTLPNIIDNFKLVQLHNRANSYRQNFDFDSAITTYENIIMENSEDAEAYFGIVLCKYGIEYVEDNKTKKRIPTCHRTIKKPIFDDLDYKEAIKHSDIIRRKYYEQEAEEINRLQKEIIALTLNEKPYDIFICYKETDESGNRTKDSVIAEEIYNELTEKNYRVFFSRITLEDKIGKQYEPIIFSALDTSKIMLVIATNKEYIQSVWVKNEWSRFLHMMENNTHKTIIPCYKDMEAYDLPDVLIEYQSQNMNKLGFMNDLLRGIDKIFNNRKSKDEKNVEHKSDNEKTYLPLLRRAYILINDGDFRKAEGILEQVLNQNPECSTAYLYQLLIYYKAKTKEELENIAKLGNFILDKNNTVLNLKNKINKWGTDEEKNYLLNLDNMQNEKIYMEGINTIIEENYEEGLKIIKECNNYKKSKEIIENFKKVKFYIKFINLNLDYLVENLTNDEKTNEKLKLLKSTLKDLNNDNDNEIYYQEILQYFKELNEKSNSITSLFHQFFDGIDNYKIETLYNIMSKHLSFLDFFYEIHYEIAINYLKLEDYKNAINFFENCYEYKNTKFIVVNYDALIFYSCLKRVAKYIKAGLKTEEEINHFQSLITDYPKIKNSTYQDIIYHLDVKFRGEQSDLIYNLIDDENIDYMKKLYEMMKENDELSLFIKELYLWKNDEKYKFCIKLYKDGDYQGFIKIAKGLNNYNRLETLKDKIIQNRLIEWKKSEFRYRLYFKLNFLVALISIIVIIMLYIKNIIRSPIACIIISLLYFLIITIYNLVVLLYANRAVVNNTIRNGDGWYYFDYDLKFNKKMLKGQSIFVIICGAISLEYGFLDFQIMVISLILNCVFLLIRGKVED